MVGWTLVRVFVYPVLFTFALYYASKELTASLRSVAATLMLASFVAAFLEVLATRQVAIMIYGPAQYSFDLFVLFLPETVLSIAITKFFLGLGAVALSKIWTR